MLLLNCPFKLVIPVERLSCEFPFVSYTFMTFLILIILVQMIAPNQRHESLHVTAWTSNHWLRFPLLR